MAQTSPFASTSVDDCFQKYQEGNAGNEFCFGQASIEQSSNGAAGDPVNVQVAALIQPDEDEPGTPKGTACEAAADALGYSFDGVIYPPHGCFVNLATKKAAFYVRNLTDATKPFDTKFSPLCVRYTCPSDTEESTYLTRDNNPDDELKCKLSQETVNNAQKAEAEIYSSTFFPITFGGLMPVVVFAGYIFMMKHEFKTTLRKLPFTAHKWIWAGLWLRVMDVATDWGFVRISLQSDAFVAACISSDTPIGSIQTACLVFCIFGTLLAPLDIWGSFQRMVRERLEAGSWTILLISGGEDVPQLTLNALYISIMYRYKEKMDAAFEECEFQGGIDCVETLVNPFDPISTLSLLASVGNICYNVFLMVSIYAVREYIKLPEDKKAKIEAKQSPSHQLQLDNVVLNDVVIGKDFEKEIADLRNKYDALEKDNKHLKKENKRLKKKSKSTGEVVAGFGNDDGINE
jgi:hypothetical protein